VEDAKSRIEDSLDSRANVAAQAEQTLKNPSDETIVHTVPEASSIVHTSKHEDPRPPKPESRPQPKAPAEDGPPNESIAARYANLQKRFGHFMDNFQTHIFTASRRLNDLTGYSGIEALKNDIENQESVVQQCRQDVKAARAKYSEAIAQRSSTQREVNDLLHRKHTWTSGDLERFTSLYRSDHANEQVEAAAQKSVSDAEQRYEEASTKLAKAILARYHEEQIWSDKIRQMSTWGTWGLMGINVLLFVIFQVVLEPWRRKRLVQGFEEKVEHAIKESEEARATAVQPNQSAAQARDDMTAGAKVEAVADNIAGQIVDAITGTASDEASTAATPPSPIPSQSTVEAAAETLTTGEIAAEEDLLPGSPDIPLTATEPILPASRADENGSPRWTSPSSALAKYEDYMRSLFSEDHKILVSQWDLTKVAMEGVAGGVAVMGLLFVLLRPR
jgi:sensitive to high expression protein 9